MHFYATSHQSACLLFSLSNEVNIEGPGPWCWKNPGGEDRTNLCSICFHCPPHFILTTSLAFYFFPTM
ncbi:rCG62340 [Rattus norvegicus]|uniref:RCG62340 n=1 Tax=Rattus norvegicus TaxID=10116 RepID=A6HAK9_RAT|nr:rCG62340 [Rattus norvegicus]